MHAPVYYVHAPVYYVSVYIPVHVSHVLDNFQDSLFDNNWLCLKEILETLSNDFHWTFDVPSVIIIIGGLHVYINRAEYTFV